MFKRMTVQALITVAAVLWGILLLLQGVVVEAAWLRPYSLVVGLSVVLAAVFDRWAWRLPLVRKLGPPILHGTWKGELVSTWVDRKTGQQLGPIEAYLVVQQTFSEISLSVITSESKSRSATAKLDEPARGQCLVMSTYMNIPRLLVQNRSRIHRGGFILEVDGTPVTRLEGFYWTDRDTKGEATFTLHQRRLCNSFSRCQTLFEQ